MKRIVLILSVLALTISINAQNCNTWLATSTVNAPTARNSHSGIWTGTEMIVWGGFGLGAVLSNTGGRYNPVTDTWVATSLVNAPSARVRHTAVWTGTEMIIWGGYSSYICVNSGGRYNPITDTWVLTTLTNAPSGRQYHSVVWTGTEMITWGGNDGGNTFNTGGRYNPATDSWTPTNTTNAPVARWWHTSIWTGSEMIVWGGTSNYQSNFYNTGGKYDPASDTWTATSIGNNVPSVRAAHTSIWTGSEMIVFGGTSGFVGTSYISLNTGSIYNPTLNSWVAMNIPNNTISCFHHTAVWANCKMIVYGGDTLNTNTGIYDPSTNLWSVSNAPNARYQHTAVWTGSEMIVWGGYGNGSCLNSGIKYIHCCTSAPSSATASPAMICFSQPTTLGIIGGTLNTGANWYWYTGSCGGSLYNSGATQVVYPTTTTTYWVRAEDASNTTACVSTTVTFSLSTSATSASAIPNMINTGMSTTLTVNGGNLGAGANWNWYTGSCGGNYIISGIAPTLSPTVTTTYYVRAEGICNTTPCVTATVFVTTSCINSTSANSITGTTTLCLGSSTTLGVNGGSLGTAANWYWYTGLCGGTNVGTGTSIIQTPTNTTTYYVRAEGICNTTACVSIALTINTLSTAATSASASLNNICIGTSTVLSITGGSLGTTDNWYWYTGSCGGNLIGTGASTIQVPTTTTVYYVRAGGTCAPTICVSTTVTVFIQSNSATSITGTTTLCSGSSTTLGVNGGSLGTGANWYWYSGSCGGTFEGTGTSITQTPTATTIYYVRAEANCNTTTCVNTTVTVNTLTTTAYFNYNYSGNNTTFQFIDSSIVTSGNSITNWNWTFGDGHASITQYPTHLYVTSGTYPVCLTVTDSLGCTDTYCDSVTTNHNSINCSLYVTYTTINESATGANDGSINLTANSGTSPYTYSWSNGATTQNLSNLAMGYYDVTVTDNSGCATYASVYVPDSSNLITVIAILSNIPVDTCLQFTFDSVYIYSVNMIDSFTVSVVWAFLQTSNGTIAYITEIYGVTNQGTYSISISVTCGSKATFTYQGYIYIDYNNITLNISESKSFSNLIEIYPNPANNYITIKNNESNSTLKIFNISGQLLKEQKLNDIESTIDIKGLSSGVYIIEVISDKNIYHSKIIKE